MTRQFGRCLARCSVLAALLGVSVAAFGQQRVISIWPGAASGSQTISAPVRLARWSMATRLLPYSARPTIEGGENGQRRNAPAPARMYTHVRWTVEGWIQRGAHVTAEFRAELPEPGAEQR